MHQPPYSSPVSGEYLLPWVLLHGMRDYYDMAVLASRFDRVRPTFNLVAGLMTQIEAYASERAVDVFLKVGMEEPEKLSPQEKRFLLENFMALHPETMIRPYPRFVELTELARYADVEDVTARFRDQDWRDLQVWYFLAWTGRELRKDERVASLLARGRGFTQEDKWQLRAASLDLLRRIVPLYRQLFSEGRIEVSTSPQYHAILPLLATSRSAAERLPDLHLPPVEFVHPHDAMLQVQRGLALAGQMMEQPIAGVWPSEGALSSELLPMLSGAGARWVVTDEKLLPAPVRGRASRREDLLYRPWKKGPLAVFFRDAALSDLIGFTYCRWEPEVAVAHFLSELEKAVGSCSQPEPVVTIALDGENAWEYYVHGGMRFVETLYAALQDHPRFRVVTPSSVLAEAGELEELSGIQTGSWIDGTLRTWIGDPVKNRAWEHLAAARRAAQPQLERTKLGPHEREELVDLVLRAEASDWFWWFGRGHSSVHDAEFDRLFRDHIRAIYLKLGMNPPDELDWPLDPGSRVRSLVEQPAHLVSPAVTGRADSYYKWMSSGRVVMTRAFSHRPDPLVVEVRFGFDRERVYFRVEASEPLRDGMTRKRIGVVLRFVRPERRDLRVYLDPRGRVAVARVEGGEGFRGAEAAVESVLEVAVPFQELSDAGEVGSGTVVEMYLVVTKRGREYERFPAMDNIVFAIRGEELDVENWHV
ncbi:MAG: hypothetical protein FJ109_13395 [Deltaproteobacteria bacterium]|nr:hypothetical protein [Deltaproteobacteria bacterium]